MLRTGVVLAASLAALATASTSTNEWHKCPLISSIGNATHFANYPLTIFEELSIECLDLQVPVCYPNVCTSNKTLSVFLKRIPATRPTTPGKAVWLMQGGPVEVKMVRVYMAANGTMSLYTMDYRGAGRSSPLIATCPEIQGMSDVVDIAGAFSNCVQKLKNTYGSEAPKAFSVTSAATDLATIIQSPLLATDDVYVYGVSYGTYVVERLMHLAPKNVKGYVLDSIISESPVRQFSDWDRDVAKIEKTYYGLCDKDPICASKIGPNSKQFALDLYKKLDANDTACAQKIYAAKGLPSDFIGHMFSNMMQTYHQRNMLPAMLYRLSQCVKEVDSQTHFLAALLGLPVDDNADQTANGDVLPGDKDTWKAATDTLLYNTIVMNELWVWGVPLPSLDRLRHDMEKITWRASSMQTLRQKVMWMCLISGVIDPTCDKLGLKKQTESFDYIHDQYWNETAPVPPRASVLMLSSGIDTQTTPDYAVAEFDSMVGSNKLLLQFPFGGHSVVSTTPTDPKDATFPVKNCGMDIFNMYLQSGGNLSAIDTSCMKKVLPLNFSAIYDETRSDILFGETTDMFGDVANAAVQSQVDSSDVDDVQSKHKMETMALSGGLIACVLAVVGMALYVMKFKRDMTTTSASVVEPEGVVDETKKDEPVATTSEVAIV